MKLTLWGLRWPWALLSKFLSEKLKYIQITGHFSFERKATYIQQIFDKLVKKMRWVTEKLNPIFLLATGISKRLRAYSQPREKCNDDWFNENNQDHNFCFKQKKCFVCTAVRKLTQERDMSSDNIACEAIKTQK